MIPVDKARQFILDHAFPGRTQKIKLSAAGNHVLAADIRSKIYSPSFDQSAMDGYAIRFTDLQKFDSLEVIAEVITGKVAHTKLKEGTAIRIFTGAMIPSGADTIVIKENTELKHKHIFITDKKIVKAGAHIRKKGSQVKPGDLALEKGHTLSPASIGYLAMLGTDEVRVVRKPLIAIITTGSELQQPGKKLGPAQVYESNTITLASALQELHIAPLSIQKVKDREAAIAAAVKKSLLKADIVLLTGGISAGDYDFVKPALTSLKVKTVFHKVAQKPGKPLYFGTKNKKLIFGLPGNPASVLSCFYEFVFPAIRKISGYKECLLPSARLPIRQAYEKKAGFTHFLKAYAGKDEVTILGGQESYLLNSFARANCFIVIPEEKISVKENELVEVHYITHLL